MAGSRAFRVKVQLDVHAVRESPPRRPPKIHNSLSLSLIRIKLLFTSKGRFLLSPSILAGNVPRGLAVSEWQGGPANRRSRLLRGIPQDKPDLPAAVPRQVHLQQDLRSNSLPGGAAAHFGAGVPLCGTDPVDDPGSSSRHHPGHLRDQSGGSTVSRAVLQGSTGRSGCGPVDGADQVLSRTSLFRSSVIIVRLLISPYSFFAHHRVS